MTNYQFAMNYHFSFTNQSNAAQLLPSMKIENCEMKITAERSL